MKTTLIFFLNGKRSEQKWKTNQSTKINLIGCDTIVNSPSVCLFWLWAGIPTTQLGKAHYKIRIALKHENHETFINKR